ncbi:MAG: twin-arginine translocase TatA/TatE family subunit [Nitrospiraceae bacterium]|nr:twin-arginine translocase TatA/TatE family subunit [Nitrospiraceae bacterium]|tara:strand:+ start:4684 stop:5025 length:342 start_codon:yes stop_codon:yes gene_type:complete
MFGIGMPELVIVLLVAFLLFGPQKLPELGRSIGKAIKGFRNVTDDVKQSIEPDLNAVQHEFTTLQENIATSASEVENNLSLNPTDNAANPSADLKLDTDLELTHTRSDPSRDA